MSDIRAKLLIGPKDVGKTFTTEEYENADFVGGYFYELAPGGILEVIRTPSPGDHLEILRRLDRQLVRYDEAHPGVIKALANGSDAFIRVRGGGDRHPDRLIYTTDRPHDRANWDEWIPTLVVEVVSPGQGKRDYEIKLKEYLEEGIQEYWIIDPADSAVTVMESEGGRWRQQRLKHGQEHETALLPGFVLSVEKLFRRLSS
jgi:Uma2 family endonuclease